MTESEIQDILYREFCEKKSHPMTIPNCKALGTPGEADLISVTKSHFVHEFEIKLSNADYVSEFRNKKRKHRILENGGTRKRYDASANYFWYVAPPNVIDSVPEYAGHIEILNGELTVKKQASRIHSEPMTERERRYIERGLSIRYWNDRT
jgi:hypothetical protein